MKRAMLVYQAGIANVFEVDHFSPIAAGRNARRLIQHAFSPCEYFARGLKAAGVNVRVAYCNQAGDISESTWDDNLEEAPFRESFGRI